MYKNQLQELAQRSCFNLPSYTCIREGPDHAPRFKAIVNFNGETFESPQFCSNLRLAEHAAAEAALASLSSRGTSHSLAARILDETGVYKNLLQEIAQRVGSPLPRYTTYRSGFGHVHVFTGVVELAGITFRGEPAKNKKQAEKNAAQAAWSSLKQLAQNDASSSADNETNEEQEQIRIARALQNYRMKQNTTTANSISVSPRPSSPHRPAISTSKILPLFGQRTASQSRHDAHTTYSLPSPSPRPQSPEVRRTTQKPRYLPTKDSVTNANNSVSFGTPPYRPVNQCRLPYRGIVPPVTIRTSTPVFSAPPLPPPARVMQGRTSGAVPPVRIRQAIPVFSPPPLLDNTPMALAAPALSEEAAADNMCDVDESTAIKCLELLEM